LVSIEQFAQNASVNAVPTPNSKLISPCWRTSTSKLINPVEQTDRTVACSHRVMSVVLEKGDAWGQATSVAQSL